MHIHTAVLTLLWLGRTLPPGSAAPALVNTTAESTPLRLDWRPRLPNELLRPHAAEIIDYKIPGTTTVIHFILGPPLPRAVMSETIISAYNDITYTIASEGDSILPASQDPFVYDRGYGAFIRARSAEGRHLTWSFLEGAVVGLHNGLYLRGKYCTSLFWILDGVAGLVGTGEMDADIVGAGGRNGTVTDRQEGNGNDNDYMTSSGIPKTS